MTTEELSDLAARQQIAQQQEAAQTASVAERAAATTDLRDQAAAMLSDLNAIIARNSTFTQAQAGQALDALAKSQKRLLRLLKAQVG